MTEQTAETADATTAAPTEAAPVGLDAEMDAAFDVIDARGKDQRGNGTAAAVVTATLAAQGSSTRVDVLTDLNITGRPAQFGRGVMTDVGNKLLGQFADKLAAQLGEGDAQGDADRAAAAAEPSAPAKAAATVTGAVEEVAASAEQAAGNGAGGEAVKKAAAGAKKAAAAATDKVSATDTVELTKSTPAKKAPAKKTAAAKTAPVKAVPPLPDAGPAATDTAPATGDTAPATGDTAPAKKVAAAKGPSSPPGGPTAPPTRPATGAPVRSVPSAGPRTVTKPQQEPEPIDLLEVAGGAAMARYAAPAAGIFGVLLLLTLLIRRRRRRRR